MNERRPVAENVKTTVNVDKIQLTEEGWDIVRSAGLTPGIRSIMQKFGCEFKSVEGGIDIGPVVISSDDKLTKMELDQVNGTLKLTFTDGGNGSKLVIF